MAPRQKNIEGVGRERQKFQQTETPIDIFVQLWSISLETRLMTLGLHSTCRPKPNTRLAPRFRRNQMSFIERAITANRKREWLQDPWLTNKPAPKVAILTCMDPRLNQLLEWLDIKSADADLIRNVGTAVTEDVVRSLMFSIHVLGVPEIMIVGHTGCGMEMFSEEDFENHLHTQTGTWAVVPDKFHFYSDVNRATEKQVLKLRSHPWVPSKVAIRGFVFDLATGELREVTPKNA
jgi:carbonic anhydrase